MNYNIEEFSDFVLRDEKEVTSSFVLLRLDLDELIQNRKSFLHPSEEDYYNDLIVDKRRFSYLIGRYVAKKAVASCIKETNLRNIYIKHGVFSQPIVEYMADLGPRIQVSISHSNYLGAAIAFPDAHPMAIDIEPTNLGNRIEDILQLSEMEKALINNLSIKKAISLTLLWTVKEAISKVLRTGLTTNLSLFEINSIEMSNNHFVSLFSNFYQYKAVSRLKDGYVWTIVLPKNSDINIPGAILIKG
jgi:phosphopantetheinyl transferase